VVDSTADFLNSAQLPFFVRVTGNNGFLTKSLLTKRLHAKFHAKRLNRSENIPKSFRGEANFF